MTRPTSQPSARQIAVLALVRVESSDTTIGAALSEVGSAARRAGDADKASGLAREIVSGVLRHRARLDAVLAPLLKKPLPKLDAPVRAALRAATYERVVLQAPAPVVGNEYAELMRTLRLSSATGFVNAVARRLPGEFPASPEAARDPVAHLAQEESHPAWMVERWLSRLGFDQCRALCEANNRVAPLSLRVNTRLASRDGVVQSLRARNVEARAGELSPDAILVDGGSPLTWPEWREGKLIAQDEAAQLVAHLATPQAGQTVLDCAAAPGGKSTHLAQMMSDDGLVIACDSAPGRLKLVAENARRLNLRCIETRAVDFRDAASVSKLPAADVVLLDAPCSGTGTLRRRPDAKWRKTSEQLSELVELQRVLLHAAATRVKIGGVLVYSTCSLEAEENQDQARAFTNDGGENWRIEPPEAAFLERVRTPEDFLQTWPHRHGCDGMFAARWRRVG